MSWNLWPALCNLMEECRQIFCSRNFILSALRADSAGMCWNTIKYKSLHYNQSSGKSPWDLNRRQKKVVSPCLLGTTTKPPKGGNGENYETLGWLKYSNLAIKLGMRHRTFTRPFIVWVLSRGKPIKNTVLLNSTCITRWPWGKLFLQNEQYIRN